MQVMSRACLALLLLTTVLAVSACGASRETALARSDAELMKAQAQGDFARLAGEGDELWEKRRDRASLEQALAKWEEATTVATPDMDEAARRQALGQVYIKLTHGYYFLADAHIRFSGVEDEEALEDEMKGVFNKGVTAAEKGLAISSPAFAQEVRREAPFAKSIKVLGPEQMPLLYWYSANLGKWALLEGFTEILSRKDDIKVAMDMIEAQSPDYFYGAPLRYFGVYYTKLPFPGGDPPTSKKYFERAMASGPDYLATRVLMAENYATKVDNKKLYKEHLEAVVAFDLAKAPALVPENHFEQLKAKRLLDQIDDNF
jgi:hypothetical protein